MTDVVLVNQSQTVVVTDTHVAVVIERLSPQIIDAGTQGPEGIQGPQGDQGPPGPTYQGIDSITIDGSNNISLVNDSDTVTGDGFEYYGTDIYGTLGWHALPVTTPYSGIYSVCVDMSNEIQLVNDCSPPGCYYYGTDCTDALGYHPLPTPAVYGIDSVVVCQGCYGEFYISLFNDCNMIGVCEYYGTDGAGNLGYHTLPSSGGGCTYQGIDSIYIDSSNNISLLNDLSSPGYCCYYGTDNGCTIPCWKPLPGGSSVYGIDSVVVNCGAISLVNDVCYPGYYCYYGTNGMCIVPNWYQFYGCTQSVGWYDLYSTYHQLDFTDGLLTGVT